jgi:hypothetical protein
MGSQQTRTKALHAPGALFGASLVTASAAGGVPFCDQQQSLAVRSYPGRQCHSCCVQTGLRVTFPPNKHEPGVLTGSWGSGVHQPSPAEGGGSLGAMCLSPPDGLHGCSKPLIKVVGAVEHVRHQEVEQRPQLTKFVLKGSACAHQHSRPEPHSG